ncbi:MAG: rod shape-determining protein MreC [Bacteriovoracaceae bacterium]
MRFLETGQQKWKLVVNFLVLVLALTSITQRSLEVDRGSFFERVLIDTFGPIQKMVTSFHQSVGDVFDHYVMNVNASKNNTRLSQEIEKLNYQLFELEETRRENARLKDLLAFGREVDAKKVLAQVVSWDATSDLKSIRINKGASDGVKLQSVVVTAQGLVGYIYRLTNHFSDVLTILDPKNRVDGIIGRIRTHGIVEGDSVDRAIMKYVRRTEVIELNDDVLTSGLGNIYPKGVRIGKVSKIERESYGVVQYVEIAPSVDFSRLEEVAVLVLDDEEMRRKEWQALDNVEE